MLIQISYEWIESTAFWIYYDSLGGIESRGTDAFLLNKKINHSERWIHSSTIAMH